MGVAYHAHYLVWFELGRTELMREAGCPYGELEEREGIRFPVIEAGARYLSPARYDDLLTVRTRITRYTRARIRFDYRLTCPSPGESAAAARKTLSARDHRTLATGFTVHAAVGRDGRAMRMPKGLMRKLESWERLA